MTHVAHVITGLGSGGAEGFLARLVPALASHSVTGTVFSLTDDGVHGEELRSQGTEVCPLGLRVNRPDPRIPVRLVRHLRDIRPDVVMTWLYDADIVGGIAARLAGIPVLWNIRQSAMGPEAPTRHHLLLLSEVLLSRVLPRRIICVSQSAKDDHVAVGFPAQRMVVIHNGVDVERFRPDSAARAALRQELGIPTDATVIGHVARFDPQKDHATMLRAAAVVLCRRPGTHLVMCGDGVLASNRRLSNLVEASGIDRSGLHLLGRRPDVERLMTAFDVAVSSSAYGEGLTNAIAEAMAGGIPCVATASGDAVQLLGDTGEVVPVRDPAALAEGILRVATRTQVPDAAARRRIVDHFSLAAAAEAYSSVIRDTIAGG